MKKLLLIIGFAAFTIFSCNAQSPTTNQLMSSNAVWQFVTTYVAQYVATNPVNVQITNLSLNFNTNHFTVSGTNISLNTTGVQAMVSLPANLLTNGMSVPVTFSNNVTIAGSGHVLLTTNSGSSVQLRTDGTVGSSGTITNAGNIQTLLSVISYGGFQYQSFPGLTTNFQVFAYKQQSSSLKTNILGSKGGIIYSIQNP